MKTFTRISSVLTLALSVCWGVVSAQFTCDSPLPLNCGDVQFGTTTGVTNDNATSGAPTCVTTVGTGGQYWYSFTPSGDGSAVLNTISTNTNYDTKLHVYTGSCGSLACVVGNDDFGGGLQSQVTFNFTGGTTYLIRVGGFTGAQGNFQLNFTCDLFADGCTDSAACNYDPVATNNDGTCCYGICETLVVDGGFNDLEVSWELQDVNGNVLASGGAPFSGVVCLPDGPNCGYQMVMTDSGNSGWNGNEYTFSDANGNIEANGTLAAGGSQTDVIALGGLVSGCTDMNASNYDPNADCDNGTCLTCTGGSQVFTVNTFDSFGDGWNGAVWLILDAGGNTVATGGLADNDFGTFSDCLAPGCYTMSVTGGTFPDEVSWEIVDGAGNLILSGAANANAGFEWANGGPCDIPGCTDPNCNNYNQFATIDDGSCVCPPSNDLCINATPIGCGQTVNGTTINANLDTDAIDCAPELVTSPGVWYTFIGTGDGVSISLCNSVGGDSKLHIYTGSCGNFTCVASNDDQCGVLSSVFFNTVNGAAYYVMVSEFGTFGDGFDFVLDMTCVDCNDTPINDGCATALPIPSGVDFPGNLCCNNPDPEMDPWSGFGTQYGIWYVINSADFDALDISFFNGTGQGADAADGTDVGIGVFDGANGCGDLAALVGGIGFDTDPADGSTLDGFIFNSYEFGLTLTPNTDYYICVTTSDPVNCGDFVLNVSLSYLGCTDPNACNYDSQATIDDASCEYVSCGPNVPNDLCDNAIALNCNTTVTGSTGGATNTGAPTVCPVGAGDIGVWYTFTGDGQFVTLSSCGSTIDSRITVVSSANGCAGPFTCVASEDDDASDAGCGFFDGDDASLGFVSEVGTVYYVYVSAGGVDTDGDNIDDLFDGPFSLSFDCAPVVTGCQDACACDYNPNANVDSGSCDYFSCEGCTAGSSAVMMDMVDTFGDGWNGNTYSITDLDGNEVAAGDLNGAECGDGTDVGFDVFCLPNGCYTMVVGGGAFANEVQWTLMDSNGGTIVNGSTGTFSFTIGGGVCGCTDDTACNYDAAATTDDGSCEYTSCAGCTDATACNFDATATINDPASCCFENCVNLIMNDSFGDGWNGASATIIDGLSGAIVGTAGLPTGSNGTASFCLADGCYQIIVGGGAWDGEISWTLTGVTGGILTGNANDPDGVGFSVGGVNCTPGCTEPVACNYDETAYLSDCTLCDFSSCSGCTYDIAPNYDATASIDDGSCDFSNVTTSCPADLDGNGIVGVSDLLIFISEYGTICVQGGNPNNN